MTSGRRRVVMHVGRRVLAWVVAAVVTVGLIAGGVLVARNRPDREPAVLPALDLEAAGQPAAGAVGARAAAQPAPAPAAVAVAPARQTDPPDRLPRPWPTVTYRLNGPLPSLPDRAQAWKLGNTTDPDRVAALATALGLTAKPKQEPTGWTVRDGRRGLVVNRAAGVPWTYGTGLGACGTRIGGGPYTPGPGIQCLDADAPVASPRRPADLPSPAEAERIARDLATRAGLDLAGARVRVVDSWAARTVTIAPAVAGTPTSGISWTVTVGANGAVQYASGWLATPQPADTYPLIGVQAGFEQLKKFRPLGPMSRVDVPTPVRRPCLPAGGPGAVPCTARPLPPRVATVTGVRLGLQLAPAIPRPGRAAAVAYLLPAYLFDLEGGWTDVRAVIAVPTRYLTR
jgi:hypothetical protein